MAKKYQSVVSVLDRIVTDLWRIGDHKNNIQFSVTGYKRLPAVHGCGCPSVYRSDHHDHLADI